MKINIISFDGDIQMAINKIKNRKKEIIGVLSSNQNIDQFEVYINDDYYGNDLTEIQINTGDELRINITKVDVGQISEIVFLQEII